MVPLESVRFIFLTWQAEGKTNRRRGNRVETGKAAGSMLAPAGPEAVATGEAQPVTRQAQPVVDAPAPQTPPRMGRKKCLTFRGVPLLALLRYRGREGRLLPASPPAKPDGRVSRIRLSSRWSDRHAG